MSVIQQARICPCKTDVEEPGPHIDECPFSDLDYCPPGFGEGAKALFDDLARDCEIEMVRYDGEQARLRKDGPN